MSAPGDDGDAGLPFDPATVLAGVRARRGALVKAVLVAVVAAAVAALAFAREVNEAETVLIYTPPVNDELNGLQVPKLESRRHMVKIHANLAAVQSRLGLETTLQELGRACEARLQKDTMILAIRVEWPRAAEAAAIANALRDVFLEQQGRLRRASMSSVMAELERQVARVREALGRAADELRVFREKHAVVSVDEELKVDLADLSSYESQLAAATIERRNLASQKASMGRILGDLEKKVATEQKAMAQNETLRDVNLRIERLRDAIHDDKNTRTNGVQLARAETEMKRAERLVREGLAPRTEQERTAAEYERLKQSTVDTPKIRAWKEQIQELDRTMIPGGGAAAPSSNILHEMMLKTFSIELDSVTIDEKVSHLEAAARRVRERLSALPGLQRELARLSSEQARLERELTTLEEPLTQARKSHDSQSSDFLVVSEAVPPPKPLRSNRLLVFVVVLAGAVGLGLVLVLGPVVFAPWVRSASELDRATGLAVWCALPSSGPGFRNLYALSRRVQAVRGEGAARVAVVGAGDARAARGVTAGLISQLVLQGARVAWLPVEDTGEEPPAPADVALARYLAGEPVAVDEVVGAGAGPLLKLGRVPCGLGGHLRATSRMRELEAALASQVDVIVSEVESPRTSSDAAAAVESATMVVLVAAAGQTRRSDAAALTAALPEDARRRAGWVLTDVTPAYA